MSYYINEENFGSKAMRYVLNRACEASTWRGLVWLAMAAGLTLDPMQADAIITAGLALAGLIGAFVPDKQYSK